MIGTHRSMLFLNPPLQSSTLMTAVYMSLSAMPNTAKGRITAASSVVILTPPIVSLLEIFASMREYAGGLRSWLQLMKLEILVLLLMG